MAAPTLNLEQSVVSKGVARSATIVSIGVLLSRITGLARETVLANKFGAGFYYDSFLLGFRIPNLMRDLFAEGALSSAFVPAFTTSLAKNGRRDAAHLSNLVTTALILVVGIICLLGMVFAPQVVSLVAPGFAGVPGKFQLSVRLTRIMFPYLLLIALSAQAMGMLNSSGSFGVPALASTFFNIGSVVFGLALGFWIGPNFGISPVEGMAYGVVIGGLLQLLWQLPRLRSLGFRFKPALDWSHPGLRQIFKLMLPAMLANAAVQVNVMVNTGFASRLSDPLRGPNGPISWLGYAFRFVQLPLGLFGVALAAAMLPSVSRSAAASDFDSFRTTLCRALSMVFALTIPSSLALIILGRPIVGCIYESGHFETYDTQQTALALSCYAIGLVAYASVRILSPAFYALSDARTPMVVSLFSIGINICVPLVLLDVFHAGFWSLALTTALAVSVESLSLYECLRRKLGGMEGRHLLRQLGRITGASGVMVAIMAPVSQFIASHLVPNRWNYLRELGVCVPLGFAAFVIASRIFGVSEINFVWETLIATIRRRLFILHARIQG